MSCLEWQERIVEQTGGEFAPDVAVHMRSCSDCAALAEDLESDRLALLAPPPHADYAAMRRSIRASIVRRRFVRRYVPAALAAAAILIAAIVILPHSARPAAAPTPSVTAANIPAPVAPPPAVDVAKRRSRRARKPIVFPPDLVAVKWLASLDAHPVPKSDSAAKLEIATSNPNVSIILLQEKESYE